jgi:ribonuclease HI
MDANNNIFEVWADGSAVRRYDVPEKKFTGGAAYVIVNQGRVYKMGNYGHIDTTNNRMELLAIICGVGHCPENSMVIVYSDSKYAINVLKGSYKAKKNLDLIRLFRIHTSHLRSIGWQWVKGHNGTYYNELCDQLANEGRMIEEKRNGLKV